MEASVAAAAPQTENGRYPLRVVLGEHTYEVFPQRHAYLNHRLGQWFDSLQNVSAGASDVSTLHDFLGLIGDRAYDLLKVMIPDLMPEYEFSGFATQEALDAGDYKEQYDRSPTYDELFGAFQVCLKVNRLDALKNLGKAVDPRIIRAYLTQAVGTFLSRANSESSSPDATAGPLTTSGLTSPTSEENSA